MELTAQQVRYFCDAGFIRIEGGIEPALITELHTFVKNQHEHEFSRRRASGLGTMGIQIQNVYDTNPALFTRLLAHPSILGPLRSLLGENIVMLKNRHNHAEVNGPGDADSRLHRDALQWSRGVVTALVYLEESTQANGCTHLVPGSQRLPFVDIPYDEDGGGAWMEDYHQYRDLIGQALPVPMPKGGILLFDGLVFHAAGGNRSTGTRASVTFGFRSVDELIHDPDESRQLLVSGRFIYRGHDACQSAPRVRAPTKASNETSTCC